MIGSFNYPSFRSGIISPAGTGGFYRGNQSSKTTNQNKYGSARKDALYAK